MNKANLPPFMVLMFFLNLVFTHLNRVLNSVVIFWKLSFVDLIQILMFYLHQTP